MEENQIVIPEGWQKKELGSLIIERHKSKLKVSDATNFGSYPFFTSGEAVLSHNTKELDGKNIFLATGGVANVKYYDGEAAYSTDTYTVTTNNSIEAEYLYYNILNVISYVNTNYFEGSGLKHLQKKEFKNHPIICPKFNNEQKKIIDILTKVDKAILQTEAIIAKYNRIKTGLMQQLLTKGIDENGIIRSEETHDFKDSPLGRIPVEWDCLSLKICCEKIQDGTHFSPKTDENGSYKYVTSKNIRFGFLDLENVEYINEAAHKAIYQRCSVKYGDVLLTKDGANTGNACLNNLVEEFSLLSSVALIRGKKKVVLNGFILQFLLSVNGQKLLTDEMSGNAITRITLTIINKVHIVIPALDEQHKIIALLAKKDEVLNQEKINLCKFQSFKTGLMQDLLTGKVRVSTLIKETVANEAEVV